MKWSIVTDSSCDLFPAEQSEEYIKMSSVPFVIRVGRKDFIDDKNLNVSAMLDVMERERAAGHTSCPAPQAWITEFVRADCVIAVTISSQLSGSMNGAMTAREMVLEQYPEKKIAVIDSRSTGPELVLGVYAIKRKIESGAEFEKVVSYANTFFEKTKIAFALSSFDNLVKNGRMSRFHGFLARKLRMWGIGIGSEEGRIVIKEKVRGSVKAVGSLVKDMQERGFQGGEAVISHCMNPILAEKLKHHILKIWENAEVKILPTRGLCSYYAERGGLIVSFQAGLEVYRERSGNVCQISWNTCDGGGIFQKTSLHSTR